MQCQVAFYSLLMAVLAVIGCSHAYTQQELQQMLNWGIKNSDPEKLKRQAEKYAQDGRTLKDDSDMMSEDDLTQMLDQNNQDGAFEAMLKQLKSKDVPEEELHQTLKGVDELFDEVDVALYADQLGLLDALYQLMFDDRSKISGPAATALANAMKTAPQVKIDFLKLDEKQSLQKMITLVKERAFCPFRLQLVSSVIRNNAPLIELAEGYGLFSWAWGNLASPEWKGALKAMGLLQSVLPVKPTGWVEDAREDVLKQILDHAVKTTQFALYGQAVSLKVKLALHGPKTKSEVWKESAKQAIEKCTKNFDNDLCETIREIGYDLEEEAKDEL